MTIPLTQAKYTILDMDDYDRAIESMINWHTGKRKGIIYAVGGKKGKIILLHRFIMEAQPGEEVDHINGDGLDNRRSNLRLCTHAENQHNRGKQKNNKSGYKGVSLTSGGKRYTALIKANGIQHRLGYFTDPVDAARAYDKAALELHSEFALLNFPDENKGAS